MANNNWKNPKGGDWSVASNWTDGVPVDDGTTVAVLGDLGVQYTVTISDPYTYGPWTLDISSAASLLVDASIPFAHSVTNNGTIKCFGSGGTAVTGLDFAMYSNYLGQAAPQFINNSVVDLVGESLTDNSELVVNLGISGHTSTSVLINRGTIELTGLGGLASIGGGAATGVDVVNSGKILEASRSVQGRTATGSFALEDVSINNAGGVIGTTAIAYGNRDPMELMAANIIGGTLQGHIMAGADGGPGVLLDNVTISDMAGTIFDEFNSYKPRGFKGLTGLILEHTIVNHGLIEANGYDSSGAEIDIEGSVNLVGSGTVELAWAASGVVDKPGIDSIFAGGGADRLNNIDNTIVGEGKIAAANGGTLALVSQKGGTIEAFPTTLAIGSAGQPTI
jgi:hypothetical protein